MAAVVLSLGMSATACSDDENTDGRSAEEIAQDPYNKDSEAADALYRIVSQLSVCDSLPDNWQSATFEPRVGKVTDQSQPHVRTIAVRRAADAVARYNSLTGKNLPATTMNDTYEVEGVGRLTLAVGGAGTVATIDVDVKQMPQLSQLRMVTAGDMGENGSFRGEPYYSFGDVVRDKDGCYWICVRPAYSPNGKEDTHWMSFQLNPKDNIKEYTKSKCQPQKYPVNLGVQTEKMQYLAQLLAILANPNGYKEEVGNQGNYFGGGNNGLGGLDEAAMPVDSLMKQAKLWEQEDIWEMIMPTGITDDDVFKARFRQDVTFIYEKGSTSSTNLKIPTVTYADAGHFYRGAPTYATPMMDMKTVAFDVTDYYTEGLRRNPNYSVPAAFVVRYKTGFQISSNWLFDPDPTKAIEGVEEIHRMKACEDETEEKESTAGPYYRLGDVYKDEEGSRWFCAWIAGIDELDKSPYTYFVTFDNVKASADKSHAVNLPTKSQAIRIGFVLQMFFTQSIQEKESGKPSTWHPAFTNIKECCDVDIATLFYQHWDGVYGRNNFTQACIAYNGGSATAQNVLRFVTNQVDYQEDNAWFDIWVHYPAEPALTSVAKDFSNDLIYLQDIAVQRKVDWYAPDRLSRLPMKYGKGIENSKEQCILRTQADPLANDVTNYFYNAAAFAGYTNPLSMWNEPVLFFRVAKVKDRGVKDYSDKTIDGHTLTLVKKSNWIKQGDDSWEETIIQLGASTFLADVFNNLIIDGQERKLASWRDDNPE